MNLSEWKKLLGFNPAKILTPRELTYMLDDDWLYFEAETRKRWNTVEKLGKLNLGVGLAITKIAQELSLNYEKMAIFDYVKSDPWSREMYRKYLPEVAEQYLNETLEARYETCNKKS